MLCPLVKDEATKPLPDPHSWGGHQNEAGSLLSASEKVPGAVKGDMLAHWFSQLQQGWPLSPNAAPLHLEGQSHPGPQAAWTPGSARPRWSFYSPTGSLTSQCGPSAAPGSPLAPEGPSGQAAGGPAPAHRRRPAAGSTPAHVQVHGGPSSAVPCWERPQGVWVGRGSPGRPLRSQVPSRHTTPGGVLAPAAAGGGGGAAIHTPSHTHTCNAHSHSHTQHAHTHTHKHTHRCMDSHVRVYP